MNGLPTHDAQHPGVPPDATLDRPVSRNESHSNTTPIRKAAGQAFQFHKAVKQNAKCRLAISGPSGAGKTYTLLKIATELGGPIAVVDTEHGSASKYADLFQFDVLELDRFDPDAVPDLIRSAAAAGYAVLIFDSLSHFWTGKDGELDQVDNITARSKAGNSFAAWREVSPKHNRMVHAMISAPIHILVSLRVKTEWVMERDERTQKMAPRKIGLAPVMRDGIEYEFDVFGDMDQENKLVITKSRCPALNGQVYSKPGAEVAEILKQWLGVSLPAQPDNSPASEKPWKTVREMKEAFSRIREQLGEVTYLDELERAGVKDCGQFRTSEQALACYTALTQKREVA
jgi:hypothetical protein